MDNLENISKLDYQREYSNIKNDLTSLKKKLKTKKNHLSILKDDNEVIEYLKLLENPKVAKYLSTLEELSKLEYEEFGLERKLAILTQMMCDHKALLVMEEVTYDSGVYSICKCLECKKVINTKEDKVDNNALIYVKPRTGFYFMNEVEIKKVEEEYDKLKESKKCSTRRLVKKLNDKTN